MSFIPLDRGRRRPRVAAPWYKATSGAARLAADRQLLSVPYPELTVAVDAQSNCVRVGGRIVLRTSVSGIPTSIAIRIDLPPGYPKEEPLAYETEGRFDRTTLDGHVLSSGRLCLWLTVRSAWAGRDPAARWDYRSPDALLRFVDSVAVFCERHLAWEASGKRVWPGGESAHGGVGYAEFIYEDLGVDIARVAGFSPGFGECDRLDPYGACPCGSGRKYRFCHRARVQELRRRCGGKVIDQDFARLVELRCGDPSAKV